MGTAGGLKSCGRGCDSIFRQAAKRQSSCRLCSSRTTATVDRDFPNGPCWCWSVGSANRHSRIEELLLAQPKPLGESFSFYGSLGSAFEGGLVPNSRPPDSSTQQYPFAAGWQQVALPAYQPTSRGQSFSPSARASSKVGREVRMKTPRRPKASSRRRVKSTGS